MKPDNVITRDDDNIANFRYKIQESWKGKTHRISIRQHHTH